MDNLRFRPNVTDLEDRTTPRAGGFGGLGGGMGLALPVRQLAGNPALVSAYQTYLTSFAQQETAMANALGQLVTTVEGQINSSTNPAQQRALLGLVNRLVMMEAMAQAEAAYATALSGQLNALGSLGPFVGTTAGTTATTGMTTTMMR